VVANYADGDRRRFDCYSDIFTQGEVARLLAAAAAQFPDFLPCLAIGAFAGLRSAEIERLEWQDIHFNEKLIVVAASKAKTASRRIVPLHDNLAVWLAPYAGRQGRVWPESSILFYKRQEAVAAATSIEADAEQGVAAQKPVAWKSNALRPDRRRRPRGRRTRQQRRRRPQALLRTGEARRCRSLVCCKTSKPSEPRTFARCWQRLNHPSNAHGNAVDAQGTVTTLCV
jgi:integrase